MSSNGARTAEVGASQVRQMREMCAQFKKLLRDAEAKAQRAATAASLGGAAATDLFGNSELPGEFTQKGEGFDGGGEAETGRGLSLGRAPDHARPLQADFRAPGDERSVGQTLADSPSLGDGLMGVSDALGSPDPHLGDADPTDRGRAFEHYKRGAGRDAHAALTKAKRSRADARDAVRSAARAANAAKADIDGAATTLAEKLRSRKARAAATGVDDDDVVDEEEFVLMRAGRDAKRAYRDAHGAWLSSKRDFATFTKEIEVAKASLVDDFQGYFAKLQTNAGFDFSEGPEDKLDDQEQFDKLEMERIASQDPDALAFFRAQKTRRANLTQNRTQLRQMHRNKRA